MNDNNYTIDRVEWHTNTPGNPESKKSIELRFRTISVFLNEHNLVVETIDIPEQDIPDEFEINTRQLNERGISFMKLVYDKWLQRIDGGALPDDISFLEKKLSGSGI